jgi:atypical dual specificity phosphatase
VISDRLTLKNTLICGSLIDNEDRQSDHHITIITKSELSGLDLPATKLYTDYIADPNINWNQLLIVGQGQVSKDHNTVYYLIVWYPVAQNLRDILKLPGKDFHVTLGFDSHDIHDMSKGVRTIGYWNKNLVDSVNRTFPDINKCLTTEQRGDLLSILRTADYSTPNTKLQIKLYLSLGQYLDCLDLFPDLPKNNNLSLIKAHTYIKLEQYYNACFELRSIVNDTDAENEKKKVMYEQCINSITKKSETRDRQIIDVFHESIKLSRNFSWIIPLKLAGISIPQTASEIRAFKHMGIGLVVSVLEEKVLPRKWFDNDQGELVKCLNIHYPVINYGVPSIGEMVNIVEQMEGVIKSGKGCVTHCGGGKGRAGTVLACYIAKNGVSGDIMDYPQMSAGQAIEYIRDMRPGSIETVIQEKFISEFINNLWSEQDT